MRKLALGIISLFTVSFSLNAAEPTESQATHHEANIFDDLTAGSSLNKYDLLLTVGSDEVLDEAPVAFGTQGFTSHFGWDDTKITAYRNAAIDYILTRFGIDLTNGYYDEASGTVSIASGSLVPLNYVTNYRVLSSNNFHILPYSVLTPSKVYASEYVFIPNGAPYDYEGTYTNGSGPVAGSPYDTISYGIYKIVLNRSESKYEIFFSRNYYPSQAVPLSFTPAPVRSFSRSQLFSPTYGPGFAFMNVANPLGPDENGKYPTQTRASWSFPGSFTIPDWNGFTSAPVAL